MHLIFLKDVKQRVLLIIDSYRENGYTIKGDEYWDTRQTPLINFMVYCEKNVFHLVTHNATNYKAAKKNLCEKYTSIVWFPYAAHCINLIMKDISGWTKIIHPSANHFGTTFITLKSLYDHKHDLQAMVTSPNYKKAIRLKKAKEVKLIILNEKLLE
uniref:DUF659 domain-containing protein n=1 Tax=Lactuca sativa TaxID=4236 RepID=A0A9R1VBC4_LACSA|nr:hypothetical protein LSAT_V11C500248050 [Lactuca sativa]